MHTYKCQTIRVVDGNTVDAIIDLGFNVTISQRIKLYGVYVEDIKSTDSEIKNMAIKSKEKLFPTNDRYLEQRRKAPIYSASDPV